MCLVAQLVLGVFVAADKQVFQHDGALEEVDEEVYHIIKQEKGRQVSLCTALPSLSVCLLFCPTSSC